MGMIGCDRIWHLRGWNSTHRRGLRWWRARCPLRSVLMVRLPLPLYRSFPSPTSDSCIHINTRTSRLRVTGSIQNFTPRHSSPRPVFGYEQVKVKDVPHSHARSIMTESAPATPNQQCATCTWDALATGCRSNCSAPVTSFECRLDRRHHHAMSATTTHHHPASTLHPPSIWSSD